MADSSAIWAAFGLLRVAGLPSEALAGLAGSRTQQQLTEISELATRLRGDRESILTLLHCLVPRLDHDPALRHAVLRFKRDVHNERAMPPESAWAARLAELMGSQERAEFLQWLDRLEQYRGAQLRLDATIRADAHAATNALAALLSEPQLMSAIAVSSASFHRTLLATREPCADRRTATTLATYLARAAAKTSPFSWFTTLARVRHGRLLPSPTKRLRAHLSPLFRWSLLTALARDLELAPAFSFRFVPTWRSRGRLRALLARLMVEGELRWSEEVATELSAYGHYLPLDSPPTPAAYGEFVRQLPGSDGPVTLQRLLDTGVVQVVAPWSDDDPAPLARLHEVVAGLGTVRSATIAAQLQQLVAAESQLEDQHPGVRALARERLRFSTQHVYRHLQSPTPRWLNIAKLAFEDVADTSIPIANFAQPASFDRHLQSLARMLRPTLIRRQLHTELVSFFLRSYGAGACVPVMGFLDEFLTQPGYARIRYFCGLQDRAAARRAARDPSPPVRSPSCALPSVSVQLQIQAAATAEDEPLIVVNQCTASCGGMLTRFQWLFPGLAVDMRDWIQQSYPHARLCELLPSRDVSGLSASCSGLFPRGRWPADRATPPRSDEIEISALQVRHEHGSDGLILQTPAGEPVAAVNVGVVPNHLANGALGLLLTLCDPWFTASSLEAPAPRELSGGLAASPGVTFLPRDQRGNLVMRRARWFVPTRLFPLRRQSESDADYLTRLDSWRFSHSLPLEAYVHFEVSEGTVLPKLRKPRWFSFSSLHSLDALLPAIARSPAATLTFVEILPALNRLTVRDCDNRARVTEYATLLRWSSSE